jgi:transcriptional regulator with XRE-family HTH domain
MTTSSPPPPSLADQIRRSRTARGLTVRGFSESAGIGSATLQRIEGGHDATLSTLQRISTALGVVLIICPEREP